MNGGKRWWEREKEQGKRKAGESWESEGEGSGSKRGVWSVGGGGEYLPGPLDNFQESRKTKVSTMREGASKELTLG